MCIEKHRSFDNITPKSRTWELFVGYFNTLYYNAYYRKKYK